MTAPATTPRAHPTAIAVPLAGGAAGPATRRLRLGRHHVAVDVWEGDGPAVLCLHGIPGWRGTWRGVGARLAGAHRVIAPDLLGFGESSLPEGPFHAPEEAEMALALLDALRVERVHLVGFDFGGPTALVLAGRAPRRVASLTLLATNAFGDTPIPPPLRVAKVPLLGEALSQDGKRHVNFPDVIRDQADDGAVGLTEIDEDVRIHDEKSPARRPHGSFIRPSSR